MTTSTAACQTKSSESLSVPLQQQTFENTKHNCVCVCVSDTVDEDDDLYDFVEDEENKGDEIYEDLMRTEEPPESVGVQSVDGVKGHAHWI